MAKSKTKRITKKKHPIKHIKMFIWVPIVFVSVGIGIAFWLLSTRDLYPETRFGVTFSTFYADELGLDWQEVFLAIINDLEVDLIRLPIYWSEIEQEQGTIDLSNISWMLDQAAAKGIDVMPVVGRRVPRWPECHPPRWTRYMVEEDIKVSELEMITDVVVELRNHPAILRWQVQNEPLFSVFGECPEPDRLFVQESIDLVKRLDPDHDVMITDSGELSSWTQTASMADILGVSMYRVTWNSFWGYFYYPLPPIHYQKKADFVAPLVKEVIVSELQAEPWVPSTILTTKLEDQFKSMDSKRFTTNIDYARRVGFSETYLWGVEWWYWLKQKHNLDEMWYLGKRVFAGQFDSL